MDADFLKQGVPYEKQKTEIMSLFQSAFEILLKCMRFIKIKISNR